MHELRIQVAIPLAGDAMARAKDVAAFEPSRGRRDTTCVIHRASIKQKLRYAVEGNQGEAITRRHRLDDRESGLPSSLDLLA